MDGWANESLCDVGIPRAMALCIRSELSLLEMNEKGGLVIGTALGLEGLHYVCDIISAPSREVENLFDA